MTKNIVLGFITIALLAMGVTSIVILFDIKTVLNEEMDYYAMQLDLQESNTTLDQENEETDNIVEEGSLDNLPETGGCKNTTKTTLVKCTTPAVKMNGKYYKTATYKKVVTKNFQIGTERGPVCVAKSSKTSYFAVPVIATVCGNK
jgi:hypothetical protein